MNPGEKGICVTAAGWHRGHGPGSGWDKMIRTALSIFSKGTTSVIRLRRADGIGTEPEPWELDAQAVAVPIIVPSDTETAAGLSWSPTNAPETTHERGRAAYGPGVGGYGTCPLPPFPTPLKASSDFGGGIFRRAFGPGLFERFFGFFRGPIHSADSLPFTPQTAPAAGTAVHVDTPLYPPASMGGQRRAFRRSVSVELYLPGDDRRPLGPHRSLSPQLAAGGTVGPWERPGARIYAMIYFTIERQNVQRFIRAASRARRACILPSPPAACAGDGHRQPPGQRPRAARSDPCPCPDLPAPAARVVPGARSGPRPRPCGTQSLIYSCHPLRRQYRARAKDDQVGVE